jgi:hypothetical protein
MTDSFSQAVCGKMEQSPPGAQTERRGGAGPAGSLLGGKDPPGRFSLVFREADVLLGVRCGYGCSFIFSRSFRHFAASSGLSQAS